MNWTDKMTENVSGKVVVITGASSGSGEATARHYYAHVEAIRHADDYVPMLSDHVGALNGVNMEEEVKKGAKA